MRCPFCDYEDTKVIDSRPADGKNAAGENAVIVARDSQLMRVLKCHSLWF